MWEEIGTFDNTLGFYQPVTQITDPLIVYEDLLAFWGCYRILFSDNVDQTVIDAISAKFFIVDNVSQSEFIVLMPFFSQAGPIILKHGPKRFFESVSKYVKDKTWYSFCTFELHQQQAAVFDTFLKLNNVQIWLVADLNKRKCIKLMSFHEREELYQACKDQISHLQNAVVTESKSIYDHWMCQRAVHLLQQLDSRYQLEAIKQLLPAAQAATESQMKYLKDADELVEPQTKRKR